MNYHQDTSSAKLHIRAVLLSFTDRHLFSLPSAFLEIGRRRKLLRPLPKKFLHITFDIKGGIDESIGKSKDLSWSVVAHSCCVTLSLLLFALQMHSSRGSFHDISSEVDEAGNSAWLIMSDGKLWNNFRSKAKCRYQFFIPVVVSPNSVNASAWLGICFTHFELLFNRCRLLQWEVGLEEEKEISFLNQYCS